MSGPEATTTCSSPSASSHTAFQQLRLLRLQHLGLRQAPSATANTTSPEAPASIPGGDTKSTSAGVVPSVASGDGTLTSTGTTAPSSQTTSLGSQSSVGITPTVSPNGTHIGTTTASPNPSPKINAGTVAGAAIGSAVGAAILAAIITYLLMRSRLHAKRRVNYTDGSSPERSNVAMDKSYFAGSVRKGVGSGDWTRHLPQPADDEFITRTIETIYQQIELHVDNFYSNATPSSDRVSESARALLSEMDTGLVRPPLPEAMTKYRHKKTLVKQTLARLILSNITIEDGCPGSLLPRDVAELQRSLQNVNDHQTKPATSKALAYTRVLTSYLRPTPYEDQALLARRDSTIKTMATTFSTAFEPWSSKDTSSKSRYTSLVEIMRGAASGGFLLFSQRATYNFDWDLKEKSIVNGIVTLPGFAKVTDDEGRPMKRMFVYRPQIVTQLK
ncbi:hypothetical protein M436DRAFT_68052 [Aureobasidium namibiae CBS 147.97]|uniref:Uncharacterized protein n=1 Tax=Aureobasidium namibiae CBS 147.97 TaxID=1043004 RepID=A0A074X1S5_9PEZI